MKINIVIPVVFTFVISSCVNPPSKNADTHIHDDGSSHTNHRETESIPNQEVFEISADSVQLKTDSLQTTPIDEHTHSHEGGKEHKH